MSKQKDNNSNNKKNVNFQSEEKAKRIELETLANEWLNKDKTLSKTKVVKPATSKDPSKKAFTEEEKKDFMEKVSKVSKQKGYVTYNDINNSMSEDRVSDIDMEDTLNILSDMNIDISEKNYDEYGEGDEYNGFVKVVPEKEKTEEAEITYHRTDNPVKLYYKDIISISKRLTKEGEIAIAKRIEAGRDLVMEGVSEDPITYEFIKEWYGRYTQGLTYIRNLID